MASPNRRARRAAKSNNMSENETQPQEINFQQVIDKLSEAVSQLDSFAQVATEKTQDPVLRARLTQSLVLAGTSIEILGGLNAQAKAAEAALKATAEEGAEETPETEESNG